MAFVEDYSKTVANCLFFQAETGRNFAVGFARENMSNELALAAREVGSHVCQ